MLKKTSLLIRYLDTPGGSRKHIAYRRKDIPNIMNSLRAGREEDIIEVDNDTLYL